MTQEQLAEAAGLSASFLGHIERGTRVASVDTLEKLAAALEVTPNDLLGISGLPVRAENFRRITKLAQELLDCLHELEN